MWSSLSMCRAEIVVNKVIRVASCTGRTPVVYWRRTRCVSHKMKVSRVVDSGRDRRGDGVSQDAVYGNSVWCQSSALDRCLLSTEPWLSC